jgi:hypothetical protein
MLILFTSTILKSWIIDNDSISSTWNGFYTDWEAILRWRTFDALSSGILAFWYFGNKEVSTFIRFWAGHLPFDDQTNSVWRWSGIDSERPSQVTNVSAGVSTCTMILPRILDEGIRPCRRSLPYYNRVLEKFEA